MTEETLKALQGIEHNLSGIWTAFCFISGGLLLMILGHGLRISWRLGELTKAVIYMRDTHHDHLYHISKAAITLQDKRPWPPTSKDVR